MKRRERSALKFDVLILNIIQVNKINDLKTEFLVFGCRRFLLFLFTCFPSETSDLQPI